jgi:hypothetical protein
MIFSTEFSPIVHNREKVSSPENKNSVEKYVSIWEFTCLLMAQKMLLKYGTHRFLGKTPASFSLPPIGEVFISQVLVDSMGEFSKSSLSFDYLFNTMLASFRDIVIAVQNQQWESFLNRKLIKLSSILPSCNKNLLRLILGEYISENIHMLVSNKEEFWKISSQKEASFLDFEKLLDRSEIPMHNGQCGAMSTQECINIVASYLPISIPKSKLRFTYELSGDFGQSNQEDVHFFGIGLNHLIMLMNGIEKEGLKSIYF